MIEELIFWVTGIVEDNPIPYEVKHIVFCYTLTNNCFIVFMGGCEQKPLQENMFDYFPLEAQYFDSKQLYSIKDESYFVKLFPKVIDEAFSDEFLTSQFNDKKIYFSKYGNLPKYLFCL